MHPEEPNPGLRRVHFQLRADGIPPETPNPLRSGIHHRGYLPHVKREGASYFITFRLADSLPQEVLLRFMEERARRLRALALHKVSSSSQAEVKTPIDTLEEIERDYRRKVECYLNLGVGACHLRRPEVAAMVRDALWHFHNQQYLLEDWVIMPNHVHLILWPMPNFILSEILKSRKQYTATQANLMLGKTGKVFWQKESLDHWIRNESEKSRIRNYIRTNPVKAGLCARPEEWPWGSAWSENDSSRGISS